MDRTTSEQLKYFWTKSGMTQEEAAEYLSISQSAISQYLNGTIKLNTDIILQFAEMLGINPRQIDPDIFTPKHRKTNVSRS